MSLHLPLIVLLLALHLPCSLESYCQPQQCTYRNATSTNTDSLKSQLLLDYDPYQPPEMPTAIALLLHVDDIYKIDTQSGAFWMDVVATAVWCDCNLAYDPSLNQDIKYVTWAFDDREIWQPELRARAVRDVLPQEPYVQLSSGYNGTVIMDQPFMAEYACSMDLDKTPYDTQICNWTIMSLWPEREVQLGPWMDSSMVVGEFGLILGSFVNQEWDFQNFTTAAARASYNQITYREGASVLFSMRRKAYWYTINIIIPSQIMWMMSYSSLYMRPEAVPARVSLIILSILTLITLSNRAFSTLPLVSSPVWVTDYLFVLTNLCCVHLIEYVLVHSAIRAREARKNKAKQQQLAAVGGCGLARHGSCQACGAHVDLEPVRQAPLVGAPPTSVASTETPGDEEEGDTESVDPPSVASHGSGAGYVHLGNGDSDSERDDTASHTTHGPSFRARARRRSWVRRRGCPKCDAARREEWVEFLIEFGRHLDTPSRILSPLAFVVTTMVFYFTT